MNKARRLTPRPLLLPLARLGSISRILGALALAAGGTHAASVTWDPAGNQTNSGGAGTWDLTSLFWNDDGASPNVVWPNTNADIAVFAGTGGLVTIDTALDTGVLANGLTFNVGGYTIGSAVGAEVLTLDGIAPTISVANAGTTATINSNVAGTVGLTKAGLGKLVLGSPASTFSGGISVNAGTLAFSNDASLGALANGVTLTGGTLSVEGAVPSTVNTSRVLTMGVGGGTINVDAGWQFVSAAGLGATADSLTKTGAGRLALFGASIRTGGTVVSSGVLEIDNAAALGTSNLGNQIDGPGVLEMNNVTVDQAFNLNAGGTLRGVNASGFNGTITVAPGATVNLASGGSAADVLTIGNAANDLTGGGGAIINVGGSGAVVLTNTNNVAATWAVNSGKLQVNNVGALGGNDVTVSGGATLQNAHNAAAQNFPSNVILNGGSFVHNPGANQQLNFVAGKSITIGAAGGTVDVSPGAGATSKILLGVGQLAGAGTLTKTGPGVLQLNQANTGFSGLVNGLAGTIEFQTVDSLGSGTTTITLTGGELATSGVAVRHNIVLNTGGTLSANTNANGDFQGSVNVAGNANLALRFFQTVTTANSFRISGPISGTGVLNVTAPAAATLTLSGDNSGYSGNIAINANATVVALRAPALAGAETITLNGGVLSIQVDGDGTGTPQTINYNDPITVTANSSITFGRAGNGTSTGPLLFQQALNKIIKQDGVLTIGGQTLTLNNNNGYQLQFTAPLALTATPVFFVSTASASNLPAGVVLGGPISGNFGLIKQGAGSLALTDNTNSFLGTISISNGQVSVSSDGQLGNAANVISLTPGGTGNARLRATGTFSTAHVIKLGNTTDTRGIQVSRGETLTLTSPFDVSAAPTASLIKDDDVGSLVIDANNSAWSGVLTINGGAVRVSTANQASALGSSTGNTVLANFVGAAFQMTGQSVAEPFTLNNSGINTGGVLQGVSGTNTLTGPITLASAATIGADTGSTLGIGGILSGAFGLTLTGGGTGSIDTATGALTTLTKIGGGTWTLTADNAFTGATTVNSGTLTLSGAAGRGAASASFAVQHGATLRLDSTGANPTTANRLGAKAMTILGGNLVFDGNALAASTEITGAITFGRGQDTVTVTAGAGAPAILSFGAPTHAGGSTVLFRGSGLGSVSANGVATIASTTTGFAFSGAGAINTPNKGMLPWALVDSSPTGVGTSFATADAATGILRPLSISEISPFIVAGNNISLGTEETTNSSVSINSLTLNAGGSVVNATGGTLTVTSGGILALDPNNGISGGFLTQGTGELIIHTVGNLDVTSTIVGGSGAATFALTKGGAGILTLSTPSRHSGQTVVTQGTLRLNAGNNTIALQNFLEVSKPATVDLRGTSQLVTDLFSDAAVADGGGIVTGTAGSQIVLNRDNSARNWAGKMTGAMSYARGGLNSLVLYSNNDYTGKTLLTGGTTVLRDAGRLSGTSQIDLNYATLQLDNSGGTMDLPDRVNNAADIYLRGGAIIFNSRGQTNSSETFGALHLVKGSSNLNPIRANVGVESIEMTFSKLVLDSPDAMTNFNGTNGTFGQVGNNFRILFTTPPTVTDNIVVPAVESGGNDFATYIPGLGLTALNSPGAAGYDGVTFPATSQPTQNIRLTTSAAVPTGGLTINTLNQVGAVNVSFVNATDVLNLDAGGYIKQGNNSVSLGSVVDNGQLTVGGTAGAGTTVPLYIHIGSAAANPLTINSRIVDNPNGAAVRLVFTNFNGGTMSLTDGANSYTGGTVVNGWVNNNTGSLQLNGAAGQVVIPAGGLTINNSTVTEVANGGQIHPSNVVNLSGNATLNLVGANELGGLIFDHDGGTVNPVVNTGGVLTLKGGVTVNATNIATTPTINGTLDFAGGVRVFAVNPILINGVNVAPLQVGLSVPALLQNGGLTKTGNGVLGLSAANLYSGATNINAGTVQFTAVGASLANSDVSIGAAGTLNLGGFNSALGSLAGAGSVVDNVNGVPVTTLNSLTFGGTGANTVFSGTLSGPVALIKTGSGSFQLTNPANNFTGGLVVGSGSFLLGGAGVATTGSGLLTIGNGATLSNAGLIPGGLLFTTGSTANIALAAVAPIDTGTLSVSASGSAKLNLTGTPSAGTFPLIKYGGAALTAGQVAGFKIGANPGGGFLYGLINNVANASLDVSVETLGTTNIWTGAVDGTWTPGDSSNFASTYSDGQRVTFNNSGANKTISGPPVAPQGITVDNTVGNDYSIDNQIGGALAAGLTKTGNGILRLTGANTFTGALTVNGGTLRASVSTAASGLGSGSVSLNGSTLQLDPVSSTTPGLTGRTISGAAVGNILSGRDYATPAIDTRNYFTTGNVDTGNVTTPFYTGGPIDNFGMEWTGKLNVTVPGYYSFFTNSDDGSRVYIDGLLAAQNDGSHGINTDVGGTPILLSTGYHDVRIDMTEGTGSNSEAFRWAGPGFAKALVTSANVFTSETASNAGASNNILVGSNVTVSGTSTIALNGTNFTGVEMGDLAPVAGSTLNVTGLAGKLLRAASTSLSGGTVTINTTPNVALGQLLDGGAAVTLVKQGSGRLILDNTGTVGRASSVVAGSLIDVQGGELVLVGSIAGNTNGASNPIGSAKVQLSGGSLLLDTKGTALLTGGTTTFDNAIVTTQSSTIKVQPSGGIIGTAAVPIALGGAVNGVTMADGSTLTFDVCGGARSATALGNNFIGNTVVANGANLVVNGIISGNANVVLQSTQFNGATMPVVGNAAFTAPNTYSGATTLRGQIYNAPNVLGAGLVNTAVATGAPLTLTLSGNGSMLNTSGITFTNARLTLDASGTNNGNRVADNLPIALNGSVLQYIGNTAAASGETFGVLTANGGYNAVTMSGTTAAAATTLVGDSLARANNAQIAFQGLSLGIAAVNANLLKFNTAPSAQLVGGGTAIGSTNKDVSILPYAVGTTANSGTISWRFVGYDAANGIRPLDLTNEFEPLSGVTVNANARDAFAVATAVTGRSVNSWMLDDTSTTGGAHLVTLTGTVTIGSGALLLAANSATPQPLSLTGGNIEFGTAEGIVTVTSNAGGTIASTIQNTGGTSGLTVGGSGQLALSGINTFTGSVTINGQLSIAADTALGGVANPLRLNGGILRLSAATTVAATRTVTLLANTISGVDTATVNSIIAGQVTGSGSLAKLNTGTLTLSATNNNYSGRTEIFAGGLVTNSGPSGDILNNGTLTFDQAFDGAYPGVISGFGSLAKNGSGVVTLSSVNKYTGNTAINAGGVVLAADNALPFGGNVTMGSAGNSATLAVNNNQTFGSLSILGTGTANAITIAANKMLTLVGADRVGTATLGNSTNNVFRLGGNNAVVTTSATISGAGTFTVNNAAANFALDNVETNTGAVSNLDMSGLANFSATVNNFSIGQGQRALGNLTLAVNNTITANALVVSNLNGQANPNGVGTLVLGTTNVINANTVTVGATKASGLVTFNAGLTNPTLVLRGTAGLTSTANVNIAVENFGTAALNVSNVLLSAGAGRSGGSIDALIGTLTIGRGATGALAGTGTGVFEFESGSVTAANVILGVSNVDGAGTGTSSGTINVKGGVFNAGSVVLGTKNSPTQQASGTLNLTGGVTTVSGNVTDAGGISNVFLSGGTLDMQGHTIGDFSAIDNLSLVTGTLRNVAEINAGTTGLIKNTPGTLILAGVNAYTGTTIVTDGTLTVNGSLTGTSTVLADLNGTLSGSGTITGSVSASGGSTVAPGDGLGILSTGSLSLNAGSHLALEIGGFAAGTGYDRLNVTGTVSLAGDLAGSTMLNGFENSLIHNVPFVVIQNDGSDLVSGTFFNGGTPINDGDLIQIGTATFLVDYTFNGGGDGNLNDVALIAQVPEPGSAAILLAGMAMVVGIRRPRRRQA